MCGVAKGRILAPIVFIVYINEICEKIIFCKVKLYANNAKLFSDTDRALSNFLVDQYLQFIKRFLNDWQLKLYVDKYEVVVIGSYNHLYQFYLIKHLFWKY